MVRGKWFGLHNTPRREDFCLTDDVVLDRPGSPRGYVLTVGMSEQDYEERTNVLTRLLLSAAAGQPVFSPHGWTSPSEDPALPTWYTSRRDGGYQY